MSDYSDNLKLDIGSVKSREAKILLTQKFK